MTPTPKKIFISWSGPETKPIANTWAALLRHMFDFVEPFVSTAINPGDRGLDQIKEALADTQFGVFVTTRANQHAAWLNFEAGAISNQATDTSTAVGKVAPCLVDFVNDTDLTSPLRQFQYRTLDREGVLDILTTIADANGVDASRVVDRFDLAWNAPTTGYEIRFTDAIAAVTSAAEQASQPAEMAALPAIPVPGSRPAEDMFSEILAILRDLQRREASDSGAAPRIGAGSRHLVKPGMFSFTFDGTQITPGEPLAGTAKGRRLDHESINRLIRNLAAFLSEFGDDDRFADAEFAYRILTDNRLGIGMNFPALPHTDYSQVARDAARVAAVDGWGWDFVKFVPQGGDFDPGWKRIYA